MTDYDKLDNEELLRLSLDAMSGDRDADAVIMLKTLLAREPGNASAQYLLAAMHAQLGMMDRAEEGFRAAVAAMPSMAIARFQLGQLLLVKGETVECKTILEPLTSQSVALGAYASALVAAADDNINEAISQLDRGLALPQEVKPLEGDMRGLRERLAAASEVSPTSTSEPEELSAAPVMRVPNPYQSSGGYN